MDNLNTSRKNVCVVGSGLGGLASACVLAARGHQVTVFEKNKSVGGKAAVLEQKGFRFDMGPTILTLPSILKKVFAEAGRSMDDYLRMVRLDPQWRCFFEDGSRIDLVQDVEQMASNLRDFSPYGLSASGYRDFIDYSRRMDEISRKYFFWKPIESVMDTMDTSGLTSPKVVSDLLAMRMGTSVASTIREHTPDTRVAQMFDHFVQYVGSSPFLAPSILCGIAHMQVNEGIWYPIGGTRAVPVALEKLARELGVEFRLETEVIGLQVDNNRHISGVRFRNGSSEAFDAVVSNSDSVRTYAELLDPDARKPEYAEDYEPACSGVVLYLGLDRKYPHLAHHNFVFSRDAEEEFHHIYKLGEVAPDPTAYICAPSSTEPGVAPEGGEALYVLVHAPYLRSSHDWKAMLPKYRKTILEKLARTGGLKDIESRIVTESFLTPQTIHERYRVLNGAIYGLASHGTFFGAFKPGNRSRSVGGLYLAGGSAHPGPGMPMVLMSGWIAADALDSDIRNPQPQPIPFF